MRQINRDPTVLRVHRGGEGAIGVNQPTVIDEIGEVQCGVIAGKRIEREQDEQYRRQAQQQAKAQALARLVYRAYLPDMLTARQVRTRARIRSRARCAPSG